VILPPLAAPFLAGDAWTWDVAVRYESPTEGLLMNDRERWTVRVGKDAALTAERTFLGSWVDPETFVPASDPAPEILKGHVAPDGTLSLKGDWTDPAAARALRRLLAPDRTVGDRVPGWPVPRHAVVREADARVPGSVVDATLRVEATLERARLGGRTVEPLPAKKQG
jgi:hypothetical protein